MYFKVDYFTVVDSFYLKGDVCVKKIKNICALMLTGVIGLSLAGCGGGTKTETTKAVAASTTAAAGATTAAKDAKTDAKKVSIGILQLVEHNALDSACKGFKDALKEGGYVEGQNLTIDFQNAQADQSNLKTMSQRFVNNKVDLILAIATPAAQSVAAETKSIPIMVTAVTDLVSAKLVESNEKPNTNVTGTNDMNPIKEQIDLLKKLSPNAKKVGVLYSSSEDNSILQAKIAKQAIEALGMEYVEKTVTSTNDVQQVTQALVSKVDAIYIPTDNILASSMPIVSEAANAAKIPVICGESNMVAAGGLATIGIDYYKLGRQTGQMAIKVLKGEAKPATMPVESLKDMQYTINKATAEKIGITIPEDLKQYAK
jgi:putative ABC transport system substrate-binding protein